MVGEEGRGDPAEVYSDLGAGVQIGEAESVVRSRLPQTQEQWSDVCSFVLTLFLEIQSPG